MKTKRKPALRVLAAVGGLVIALGLVLAVDALTGDPLSRAWANARALHYAGTRYPGQDFAVLKTGGGANFSYVTTVQSAQSPDTAFDVTTTFWLFTAGRDEQMVQNRYRTLARQGLEGAAAIEGILDAACPQYERAPAYNGYLPGVAGGAPGDTRSVELDLCWTPDNPQAGAGEWAALFPLDAPFDPAVTAEVPDRLCAQILWDGEPDDTDFAAVADAFDAALTAAGYDIDYYDLTLVPRGATHAQLQNSDIERLIER